MDGGILDDCLIGYCISPFPPTCKKIGRTKDEWFENIEEELRAGLSRMLHPSIVEERLQGLKKKIPECEPYVLTHGDLNFTNIIVKDDKIEVSLKQGKDFLGSCQVKRSFDSDTFT